MTEWLLQFEPYWLLVPEGVRYVILTLLKIVVLLVPLILGVAYFTYWERKIIGWIQNRIGPNRVGWKGLLQPFADLIKMLGMQLSKGGRNTFDLLLLVEFKAIAMPIYFSLYKSIC